MRRFNLFLWGAFIGASILMIVTYNDFNHSPGHLMCVGAFVMSGFLLGCWYALKLSKDKKEIRRRDHYHGV